MDRGRMAVLQKFRLSEGDSLRRVGIVRPKAAFIMEDGEGQRSPCVEILGDVGREIEAPLRVEGDRRS